MEPSLSSLYNRTSTFDDLHNADANDIFRIYGQHSKPSWDMQQSVSINQSMTRHRLSQCGLEDSFSYTDWFCYYISVINAEYLLFANHYRLLTMQSACECWSKIFLTDFARRLPPWISCWLPSIKLFADCTGCTAFLWEIAAICQIHLCCSGTLIYYWRMATSLEFLILVHLLRSYGTLTPRVSISINYHEYYVSIIYLIISVCFHLYLYLSILFVHLWSCFIVPGLSHCLFFLMLNIFIFYYFFFGLVECSLPTNRLRTNVIPNHHRIILCQFLGFEMITLALLLFR